MATLRNATGAFLMLAVTAFPGVSRAQKLSVAGGDIIVCANPSTNTGTAMIYLRNDANGPKDANTELDVRLHVDAFFLQTTNQQVPARATFEYVDDQQKQQKGPLVKTKVRCGEVLALSLEVSGFSEAGEAHANLVHQGSPLASIRVIKFNPPFKVSLNAANPDKPELTLRRGSPGSLSLKNEDPMTYPVAWDLVLSSTCGPRLGRPARRQYDTREFQRRRRGVRAIVVRPHPGAGTRGTPRPAVCAAGEGRVPGPSDEDDPREAHAAPGPRARSLSSAPFSW